MEESSDKNIKKTSRTRPKQEKPNRTKYNVSKNKENRTYKGIVFDSEIEMKYYKEVIVPAIESGEIVYCELQKPYILQPGFQRGNHRIQAIKYVADFFLKYADGHEVIIDTKGYPDNVANLKKKLFWYVYPECDYKWICYSKIDGGWCDFEYVKQKRKERKMQHEMEVTKDRLSKRLLGSKNIKVN